MNLGKLQTCAAATPPAPFDARSRDSDRVPAFRARLERRAAILWENYANEPVRLHPNSTPPLNNLLVFQAVPLPIWSASSACAAARRAIGTRYGEHET